MAGRGRAVLEFCHRGLEAARGDADVVRDRHQRIAFGAPLGGRLGRHREDAARHAGRLAGVEHGLARLLVAVIDVRETAERDRQIAGADQHEVDALRPRDRGGVVHAALRLDHHADHGAVVRRRVVAREIARQGPHAAARARAMRRKARGGHGGRRLRVGLDQRHDHALGAGVERLADRDRAVVRGAHQHRHAVRDEPDRVFEVAAVPQPVLRVDHDRVGRGFGGDLHHGGGAGVHPEHAERLIAREACTQAERTEGKHPGLRTQNTPRARILYGRAGRGKAGARRGDG